MNQTKKSPSIDVAESTTAAAEEASRSSSGNFTRASQARRVATEELTTEGAWEPYDTGAPLKRQPVLPRAPLPPRPLPPRPSSAEANAKSRPIRKAISEPPAADRTQAYDQRELKRLLEETDPTIAAAFEPGSGAQRDVEAKVQEGCAGARSANDLPTVRPAGLGRNSVSNEVSAVTPRKDTLPDQEDLTTAYVRQVTDASVGEMVRVPKAPSLDTSISDGDWDSAIDPDARDSCSFAELTDELSLALPGAKPSASARVATTSPTSKSPPGLSGGTTQRGATPNTGERSTRPGTIQATGAAVASARPSPAKANGEAIPSVHPVAANSAAEVSTDTDDAMTVLVKVNSNGVVVPSRGGEPEARLDRSSTPERVPPANVARPPTIAQRDYVNDPSELTGPQLRRKSTPKSPIRRRIGLGLVGLLAIGSTAVAVLYFIDPGNRQLRLAQTWISQQAARAKGAMAASAIQSPTERQQPSTPPRLVDVNVSVDPPEARLFLDGRAASNPLRVAYPADTAVHELRAEAAGHEPVTQKVRFDRDVTVVLAIGASNKDVQATEGESKDDRTSAK